MSSASPGRYQSRLFNFLNRQSHRLSDRFTRTVRQLKVATVWGVQILLYPMYLLVQAGLSAGRQLSSAAQAGWPQLKAFTHPQHQEQPPVADKPIQRVLNEVSTLELQVDRLKVEGNAGRLADVGLSLTRSEDSLQPSNLQPATPPHLSQIPQESSEECWVIQGVATLLARRTLVLVTVQNQILDILTPQQQQKLSAKITWEIADLLRQRRLAGASDRPVVRHRLRALDRPRVFLPMRLFWQLMAWVQTSPIALAANLFQESTLVYGVESNVSLLEAESSNVQPPNLPTFQPPNLPTSQPSNLPTSQPSNLPPSMPVGGALAFVDRTVADLESHQLIPGSEVAIALYELAVLALRERTQKLLQPLQTKFMTPGRPTESPEASQSNTLGIQALIYAAIDYFFGTRHSNLSGTSSQERSAIPANPQRKAHQLLGNYATSQPPVALPPDPALSDAGVPDPWITWGDLYGNSEPRGLAQNPTLPNPSSVKPRGKKPKNQNPKTQAQLAEAFNSETSVVSGNSLWGNIKRYLGGKQLPGKLTAPSTGESKVEPQKSVVRTANLTRGTAPTTSSPSAASSHSRSVSSTTTVTTAITTPSTASSDTNIEPAPDWIETQATPTGYVKHPLEQLLEYVDLAMVWLEELVMKVWRWVRQPRTRD